MPFAPLTTARLVLRRLTAGDAAVVARYRVDPAIARYQAWNAADADVERLASWFTQHAAAGAGDTDGVGLLVAITLRVGGALIGDCTVRARGDEPDTAELGYSLAPAYHRQGYATEAAGALCRWALTDLGLRRVVAVTDLRNQPSIAVLERLGMTRTASLATKLRGEPTVALWYELTAPPP